MTVKQSRKGTARRAADDDRRVDERERALQVHTLAHAVYRHVAMRHAALRSQGRAAHAGLDPGLPFTTGGMPRWG